MKKILVFLLVAFSLRAASQSDRRDTLAKTFQGVLSDYSEIKKSSVKLVFTEKKRHMMWARPTIKSFFKKEMDYIVFVSKDTIYQKFMDTLSQDAFMGWYAHELGHVVDYNRRGKMGALWMGVQYVLFPKGRMRMENRADKIAIEHGYGCQLLASVNTSKAHLPNWKQKQVERFYLKLSQLEELIKECEQRE